MVRNGKDPRCLTNVIALAKKMERKAQGEEEEDTKGGRRVLTAKLRTRADVSQGRGFCFEEEASLADPLAGLNEEQREEVMQRYTKLRKKLKDIIKSGVSSPIEALSLLREKGKAKKKKRRRRTTSTSTSSSSSSSEDRRRKKKKSKH
eukprot:TRINITY_DN35033_c0_g1_i1.p1 TRINITY_DN35033_c0_g1~~TRINITY_DN35033_c0_g1_i1.p1  ORF type:complete len:168 (+),score=49.23 TRINITY_DN35033_c0_g1_i1:61-504(+)